MMIKIKNRLKKIDDLIKTLIEYYERSNQIEKNDNEKVALSQDENPE